MIYSGFCEKQGKYYSINFTQINASSLEDKSPEFINGRLDCIYAGMTGCCTHPSQCSIINQNQK